MKKEARLSHFFSLKRCTSASDVALGRSSSMRRDLEARKKSLTRDVDCTNMSIIQLGGQQRLSGCIFENLYNLHHLVVHDFMTQQ